MRKRLLFCPESYLDFRKVDWTSVLCSCPHLNTARCTTKTRGSLGSLALKIARKTAPTLIKTRPTPTATTADCRQIFQPRMSHTQRESSSTHCSPFPYKNWACSVAGSLPLSKIQWNSAYQLNTTALRSYSRYNSGCLAAGISERDYDAETQWIQVPGLWMNY